MISRKNIEKYYGAAVFVFSFFWFYYPGEYVLIANQDNKMFFASLEHFLSFLDRPGGVLEYLGHFLTQFLRFRLAGAIILSGIVTSAYFTTNGLIKRASGKKEMLIIAMITPLLLVGMHNYYPHQIHHSLGFIIAIAMAAVSPEVQAKRRVFYAITIPAMYFMCGGYLWFYCVLVLAAYFTGKKKLEFEIILLTLLYPALLVIISAKFIYLHPIKQLFFSPLPIEQSYPIAQLPYIFVVWVILLIIFTRLKLEWKLLKSGWRFIPETIFLLPGIFLILNFTYNKKNDEFFSIEKLAVKEDWDGLLDYVDRHPSSNLFGTFYTNLTLVNKGMLCSSLFNYPQPFGTRGLCFEWEAKTEILKRGSDFFWAINFVNEAHHWAFESMIVEGFTQRNLKRLIQTELVRGNYIVAQKYTSLLERTLFDRKIAYHYNQFIDNPEAIRKDGELGSRLNTTFNSDFFTDGIDLEKNLKSVIANDPVNRPAFEYLMALLMLEKQVDEIASFLPDYMNLTDGNLPRLLEESLLVYNLLHREEILQDIQVSQNTISRFENYFNILRQSRDQNEAARTLYPAYKNSFWFHMNFTTIPTH